MKDNCILTAESVTEGHPDKLCDTIADAVVDACLTQDAAARVACEVMATAGKIIAAGEITAAKIPDIPAIICRTVREAGYGGSDYEVEVITHEQSPDIAEAVCGGTETGAGDQGILYGFACDETKELLPLPVVLAHRLTRLLTDARRQGIIPGLRPDGKAQVSVEYRSGVPCRVAAVVVSCQHEEELPLPEQPLTWDLGSGAGLPGIPLRMVWTRGGYYMVEVREKRALFLSSALARLQLPSTHVFRGSVEHFFQGQYYPADCIVSRAFMPWPDLLELTLPRLRPEGVLVILALTPAPERLPAPWRLAGVRSYVAAGSGRWFWALSPSSGTDVAAGKSALDGPAGEDGPCPG